VGAQLLDVGQADQVKLAHGQLVHAAGLEQIAGRLVQRRQGASLLGLGSRLAFVFIVSYLRQHPFHDVDVRQ
jgi:hypothetical protein